MRAGDSRGFGRWKITLLGIATGALVGLGAGNKLNESGRIENPILYAASFMVPAVLAAYVCGRAGYQQDLSGRYN